MDRLIIQSVFVYPAEKYEPMTSRGLDRVAPAS
jgi:hypothetical protein